MRVAESGSIARWLLLCRVGSSAAMALCAPCRGRADAHEFVLRGAPSCAVNPNFPAEVQKLAASEGPSRPSTVHVTLDETGTGIGVSIVVTRTSGTSERRLVLPTCNEANDAAVLLAALSLTPRAQLPAGDEVARAAPSNADREQSVRWRWFIRPAALLSLRTFGAPSVGPALDVGSVWRRLVVDVSGRYLLPRAVEGAPPPATVRGSAGSVAVRVGARAGAGRYRASLVGGLELGAIRADAAGLVDERAQSAPFLAVLGGLSAELLATERVALDCGLELGVTLVRPKLGLAEQSAFFALPKVVGNLTLGVRFWPGKFP